jgi:transcriptional regulator NrdR family protein
MDCPKCGSVRVSVVMTTYSTDGRPVRRRYCNVCAHRWYTLQAHETLLDPGTFRWVERNGRRRAVKLIDTDPSTSPTPTA